MSNHSRQLPPPISLLATALTVPLFKHQEVHNYNMDIEIKFIIYVGAKFTVENKTKNWIAPWLLNYQKVVS